MLVNQSIYMTSLIIHIWTEIKCFSVSWIHMLWCKDYHQRWKLSWLAATFVSVIVECSISFCTLFSWTLHQIHVFAPVAQQFSIECMTWISSQDNSLNEGFSSDLLNVLNVGSKNTPLLWHTYEKNISKPHTSHTLRLCKLIIQYMHTDTRFYFFY